MTLPADLLPSDWVDPTLTPQDLADGLREALHRRDPEEWRAVHWQHLLANAAAAPLSPEALAALAAAAVRLQAVLEALEALDSAGLALARHLQTMPARDAGG